MPIPEEQLEDWSQQGPLDAAEKTFAAARSALIDGARSLVRDKQVEVFLQGSFREGTNTPESRDVDLVAMLTSVCSREDALILQSRQENRQLQEAWQDFRLDVLGSLRAHFGLVNVEDQPDRLQLAPTAGLLGAGVAVCIQHRIDLGFANPAGQSYVEGISCWTQEGMQVIGYPKRHHDNGAAKDGPAATNGWFRAAVRMFKRARSFAAAKGALAQTAAPSYFTGCLIYNAPDRCFGGSFQNSFTSVMNWLSQANLSSLKAQNGIDPLLGTGPGRWPQADAQALIKALIGLWNDWS